MYLGMLFALFVALPLASIAIERTRGRSMAGLTELALKWFVFWAVGVRLFTAGASQVMRPDFTAASIFQISDPVVIPFIQELGFANIAMGLMAMISLGAASWRRAAALLGFVFFGAAGVRHALSAEAFNTLKLAAMASDLYIAAVLGVLLALSLRGSRPPHP
ncbi:hypothetical protein F1654_10935 [Alkalicaulis satelles]|uniref:DoxX family protein n=1 Tax=Alkalicaulis satelles TaxID=2609175 RepID=A0A5M6ZC73_9PROT|nr:DUF6790 family protein [Alkalicaulis satelles]KAA5802333.1 hypothetical protein F1654_10935 [Alkalicaulis satelles]